MQHLTRQHNLPVTGTDAVDRVSSMIVVELQLGSEDPQADIVETVKKTNATMYREAGARLQVF